MEQVTFTREEFYLLIWTTPVSHPLKRYALKQQEFKNLCQKFEIPVPGTGYWTKIRNQKPIERKALPLSSNTEEITLTVRSEQVTSFNRRKESNIFKIPDKLKNPHHFTIETKRLWEELKYKGRNYDRNIPHFSIRVEPPSKKRALLFMDTFAKILEKRGHHLEYKYYRPHAVLYGIDIELDIREAARRIPKPGSYPTFELEYTGDLILMTGKYSLSREWRDGKVKLEGMLEKIITWMEAHAREWADRQERSRMAEAERQYQKEIQENIVALQQQEHDSFKKLLDDSRLYHEALKLREYINAVESKAMQEKDFDQGLQDWINWARKKADLLDPITNSLNLAL